MLENPYLPRVMPNSNAAASGSSLWIPSWAESFAKRDGDARRRAYKKSRFVGFAKPFSCSQVSLKMRER